LQDRRIRDLHIALERRRIRVLEAKPGVSRAAVALVVRPRPHDLEILLIQRPTSERDPWSGHMALPGGRRNGEEEHLETAIRETREEVGIDLESIGLLLGRLDDLRPSTGGPQIAVAPFVFAVGEEIEASPHPAEVAATVWVPLRHLAEPESAAEHLHVLPGGQQLRFPALAYDGYVIWGLTYRMLIQFLGIARSLRTGEVSR
jgi:8-oxo-dGTP pyrophosphatase MutT (NUDIX family)